MVDGSCRSPNKIVKNIKSICKNKDQDSCNLNQCIYDDTSKKCKDKIPKMKLLATTEMYDWKKWFSWVNNQIKDGNGFPVMGTIDNFKLDTYNNSLSNKFGSKSSHNLNAVNIKPSVCNEIAINHNSKNTNAESKITHLITESRDIFKDLNLIDKTNIEVLKPYIEYFIKNTSRYIYIIAMV